MRKIKILFSAALVLAVSVLYAQPYANMLSGGPGPEELFFSDTMNVYTIYRTYPVPETALTPAPKGYEPVYISMYARHGSRKLHRKDYSSIPRSILSAAGSAGLLTPFGQTVLEKVAAIDDDLGKSVGDLTHVGEGQHKGIAGRMYRNYKSVFSSRGAVIRCYSTAVQRTMMSMFANNTGLLELDSGLKIERQASGALWYLNNGYCDPCKDDPHRPYDEFLDSHLDYSPILSRLFSGELPHIPDMADFIRSLYLTGAIVPCLDIEGCGFVRELFSPEELYVLDQGMNFMMYMRCANSVLNGDNALPSQIPLVQDIVGKADAALASSCPGADLRFGHDSYLLPLVALLDVNGAGARLSAPEQVESSFQAYMLVPMAGNLQFIFYRNKKGNVLVKILLNEVESAIPVKTDIFPYYDWEDMKAYFRRRMSNFQ